VSCLIAFGLFVPEITTKNWVLKVLTEIAEHMISHRCYKNAIDWQFVDFKLVSTIAFRSLKNWWPLPDSNRGPDDYESYALTN
jgi:hypothetical protein